MSTTDVSPQLRLGVVSLFPEMFSAIAHWGVTGRAFESGLCQLHLQNPREEASDRHGSVDDRPYGGGPGMVMQAPILATALAKARVAVGGNPKVVAMSPQGVQLDVNLAQSLASEGQLIVVAGRYEGIDERFMARHVDLEVSVGDYVVSGGELPAMILIDALIRWLPGALGHEASAAQGSFSEGLLDCPHYTRPEVYDGLAVPPVLLSGHHGEITGWRRAQALRRTLDRRPDLLKIDGLSDADRALLNKWDLLPH